jgi:hypothetical protein
MDQAAQAVHGHPHPETVDPFTGPEATELAAMAVDQGGTATASSVQAAFTGAPLSAIQLAKLWAAYGLAHPV